METVTRGTVLVNPEVNKVCDEDKEKLSELYEELGKSYYEGAFEDPLPQLLPIFDSRNFE